MKIYASDNYQKLTPEFVDKFIGKDIWILAYDPYYGVNNEFQHQYIKFLRRLPNNYGSSEWEVTILPAHYLNMDSWKNKFQKQDVIERMNRTNIINTYGLSCYRYLNEAVNTADLLDLLDMQGY